MSQRAAPIHRADTPHPCAVRGYHHPLPLPTIPEQCDLAAAAPLFCGPNFAPDTGALSAFLEYAIEKNWVAPIHKYKGLLERVTAMHEEMQAMRDRLDVERRLVLRRSRNVRDREDRVEEGIKTLDSREEEVSKKERELAEREHQVALYLAEQEEMRKENGRKWWKAEYWRNKMK